MQTIDKLFFFSSPTIILTMVIITIIIKIMRWIYWTRSIYLYFIRMCRTNLMRVFELNNISIKMYNNSFVDYVTSTSFYMFRIKGDRPAPPFTQPPPPYTTFDSFRKYNYFKFPLIHLTIYIRRKLKPNICAIWKK